MTAGSRWSPIILTIALAGLWVTLARWRPGVTYHLAPLLVAVAYPFVRWRDHDSYQLQRRMVDVAVGGVTAVTVTFVLDLAGWLQGPAVVGGSAAGEAYLLIGVAAVLSVLTALWMSRSE